MVGAFCFNPGLYLPCYFWKIFFFSSLNFFSVLNVVSLLPKLVVFWQICKLEAPPTSKDVKHIDRKLKSCLDPGSHDKYFLSTFPRLSFCPILTNLIYNLCHFWISFSMSQAYYLPPDWNNCCFKNAGVRKGSTDPRKAQLKCKTSLEHLLTQYYDPRICWVELTLVGTHLIPNIKQKNKLH